ncbi:unnamed protein product [Euphydryas editha]|uniref:Uncharacterized protein n=1 Tax=Euphydryas editha TaxID=104508 RepID=A0AAU9TN25_EUPED|nr:unnamed protein product [Euphydryas editha]
MQKRYLLDTMKNLFITFKKENPNESCSYSYFTKQRPFYVKPSAVDGRDTCQCKMHTNTQYMLNAIYSNKIISESNMTQVIEKTVSATDNRLCMQVNCASYNIKEIIYDTQNKSRMLKWQEWVRPSEIIDNKSGKCKLKVTKNVKEITEGTVEELMENLEWQL